MSRNRSNRETDDLWQAVALERELVHELEAAIRSNERVIELAAKLSEVKEKTELCRLAEKRFNFFGAEMEQIAIALGSSNELGVALQKIVNYKQASIECGVVSQPQNSTEHC